MLVKVEAKVFALEVSLQALFQGLFEVSVSQNISVLGGARGALDELDGSVERKLGSDGVSGWQKLVEVDLSAEWLKQYLFKNLRNNY